MIAVAVIYSMGAPSEGASSTTNPAACRVSVTADILNVRVAPDAKADVVGKFKQGAETDADPAVQNGFRKLGENRWASTEFLKPLAGRNCG
ncbi:hypothetical protein Acsp05_60910 [Actinokineospora sp. NBRC 105648]|nr:hypothetical protein Acsp05_60910 [Actinokineospora sp. NBRC 105648]